MPSPPEELRPFHHQEAPKTRMILTLSSGTVLALLPVLMGIAACDSNVDYDGDGYTADVDCNDEDLSVNPAAQESCNTIDDDCDGQVDEGVTTSFYPDTDGDGYGQAGSPPTSACTAPAGFVTDQTDCDDTDASISPLATETCDGSDNDCNTQVDEAGGTAFYPDTDGDGYGQAGSSPELSCTPSAGRAIPMGAQRSSGSTAVPVATAPIISMRIWMDSTMAGNGPSPVGSPD